MQSPGDGEEVPQSSAVTYGQEELGPEVRTVKLSCLLCQLKADGFGGPHGWAFSQMAPVVKNPPASAGLMARGWRKEL